MLYNKNRCVSLLLKDYLENNFYKAFGILEGVKKTYESTTNIAKCGTFLIVI